MGRLTVDTIEKTSSLSIEAISGDEAESYKEFLSSFDDTNTWQTAERIDSHIRRAKRYQAQDRYGIGSAAYDNIIRQLENRKSTYSAYETAEDYNANHEKNVAYYTQLLEKNPEELRKQVAELEGRYNTSLNIDGSRDVYEQRLEEEKQRWIERLTAENYDGLSEEEITKLAIQKAKSDPQLAILGAQSGADTREDPNVAKAALDQKRYELNKTLMVQKEHQLTEEALASPDFAQKSAYNAALANKGDKWSRLYAEINSTANGAGTNNVGYMSEAERALFNYHFAVGGASKAEEYLTSIQDNLNSRKAGEIFENRYEGRVLKEIAYGLYAGLDSAITGIGRTFGEKKDFYSTNTAQHLAGRVSEDVAESGWVPSFAYSVTTSVGQMAPTIAVSMLAAHVPVVGATLAPIAGAAVTGTSVYGNAYAQMINEGYSSGQASSYALLASASEAGLEMVMGGISKLRVTKSAGALVKIAEQLDKGLLRSALFFADAAADEFKEEALQELLEPIFKTIATGVDDPRLNDVDWGQALYAGFVAAITAGVLNGAGKAVTAPITAVRTAVQGKRLVNGGLDISALKAAGEALPAETVAHKLASKVTENSGAYTIARLFNEVGAELTKQNQADIAENLARKGARTKDAETIAAYLAAVVNGAYFTPKQVKALENNPLIAETVRDVLIDPKSSVNQRTQSFKNSVFPASPEVSLATDGETGYTGVENEVRQGVHIDGNRNASVLGNGRRISGESAGNHGVWQSDHDTQEVSGSLETRSRDEGILPKARDGSSGWMARKATHSPDSLRHDASILGALSQIELSEVDTLGRALPDSVRENFKDTVFKNENGRLLSLYHWTDAVFDRFEHGQFGFHLGTQSAAEKRYSDAKNPVRSILKECYVDVKNPIVIDYDSMTWTSFSTAYILNRLGAVTDTELDAVLSYEGAHSRSYDAPAAEALRALLKSKGYDGILYRNDFEGDTSVIVFDASQIYIVADHESVIGDSSLPSSDGTGRDSYTPNAEIEQRIRAAESDFSTNTPTPWQTADRLLKQQNPQQSAVGVDSRAQNADAARDTGVEIGVRPSEADSTLKTMEASKRQELYASLESHTGAKIVEDATLPFDGEYDPKTQTIRINPNRATPFTVIKHELTHYIESSGVLYQDFMNYALKSETFRLWLESKGKTLQDLRNETTDLYAKNGVKLDEFTSTQEILANFAAEKLFTDIEALREMHTTRPKLFERLRHFVQGIINKIKGVTTDTELERLEQMFSAAVQEVRTAEGEIKYSFEGYANNGKGKYQSNFSIGTPKAAKAERILRYIKEVWSKKPIRLKINENGKERYIYAQFDPAYDETGNVPTDASKLMGGNRHGTAAEQRVTLDLADDYYQIASEATYNYSKNETGKDTSTHQGVSRWHYFINDIYFAEHGSEEFVPYRVTINVKEKTDGHYVYSFSAEKTKGQDAPQTLHAAVNSGANSTANDFPYDSSIAEPPSGVKGYSTQDGTKKFISSQNPLKVAQLKPEDAYGTPPLEENGPMNRRSDGESAFADSVQGADIFSDELKQLAAADENVTRYDVVTNKETMRAANRRINTGGRAFVERFMQKDSASYTTDDNAVALILISRYEAVGDHRSALVLMEKLRAAATAQGQAVQVLSLISRLSPDGMAMYAQKELANAYEEMVKGRSEQWAKEHKEQFNLTDEDIEFIRLRTWQAAQLPKGRDKDIRLAEIASRIQSKIPQAKGQAFNAWQRTAMLLNPKTQLRNVLGNFTMVGAFYASDAIGSVIDRTVAKKTGVRTTFAGLNGAAVKGMKQGFFESYDDFIRHINTRDIKADRFEIDAHSLDNFNEHHTGLAAAARNKMSRALNALDRFNSFLLDAGDRPFYEMWYLHSLNGQMAAAGTSEPTADMIEIATLDALERTWQDTNALTKFLSGLKNGMNHIQFQGYGLGDVVLKFVKTPANLTKAMVEFSPVGLIKAIAVDASRFNLAVKENRVTPQMQRRFVKNMANGIVGTMITFLAAALAAAGAVTGEQDEDKDVAAFERAVLGYQPYSVKIGGMSFSYDWMQPIGAHVAAAANYFQEKENAELTGEKLNLFNTIFSALKAGGRVLFDQSFMQSIHTFMGDDDLITNIINSLLTDINAPIPQLFSQTASALDPVVRNTFESGNDVQTAVNKVLYKIPGARQTLAPSVDVLGNERKQLQNGVARAFTSYVSPFNVGAGYDSAAGEEMYRLYKATGDASAIAPSAPNYVSTSAGKHTLTAHQKAEYQTVMGRTAAEAVEKLTQNDLYEGLPDEQKVELLTSIYTYARQAANNQVLGLPLNDSATKAQQAIDSGVPTEWYFLLKKTVDTDGVSGVTQKEARELLDGADLTREQKAAMWKSFNKGWKNNPYGRY